jgi:hypothetical protein
MGGGALEAEGCVTVSAVLCSRDHDTQKKNNPTPPSPLVPATHPSTEGSPRCHAPERGILLPGRYHTTTRGSPDPIKKGQVERMR